MPTNAPLIIDSADRTPPIPSRPPHATISGADWPRTPRTRLEWPWHVSVTIGALCLIGLGLFLWWLSGWAARNPGAADAIQWGAILLLCVLSLIVVVWIAAALYYSIVARYGYALRVHVERSRLGNAVPVAAIVGQSLRDVQAFEAAAIGMQVAVAPHQRYPLLSTLSEGSHEEATTTINGLGEETAPPLLPDGGPILQQLRKRYAKSAEHLFVGTVGETPVHLRWGAAGLSAIAGGSGSGKTNTTRLIAAWHALNGGGLALCDGHGEVAEESLIQSCDALAPAFVLPPAVKADEIGRTIRRMDAIGRARLAGESKDIPLLLVIDEFTSLCRNHPDAADLVNILLNFGDEYRKVNMQALIIGHHWRGDLIDKQLGAALRSAIGARIIHTTAPEEAKFLLRPAEAQGVERLRIGEALFFDRAGDVQKIVVPWLPAEVLREVGYPVHPGWPLSAETPAEQQRSPEQRGLDTLRRRAEAMDRSARLALARDLARKGLGQQKIAYACKLSDEAAGMAWRAAQARIDPL